jgi:hypothetical protein
MANNKINISDLDFDLIKTNLKEFLKTQDQFTDYDFEGSGLNVLLDVLAYNTHYNAMYTNLAINEMFLDSASKRDSVISIANNYGYLPISATASKANISMTMPIGSNTSSTLSIPKFSPFISNVSGVEYIFYTLSEHIGLRNESLLRYEFDSIDVYEGKPVVEKFNYLTNTKIILQNLNIDVKTIKLSVNNPTSINTTSYKHVENVLNLNASSEVFFIKEIEGQKYEIYFGKNNLGKEPELGSIITVEYIVTNGSAANGVKLFTYSGQNSGALPTITVNKISSGGREIETVDEIKYNVSHKYKIQDRAVTIGDYIDIIKTNYADIDTISCWGGDTMSPPVYGKVYICIKPKSSLFLTLSDKNTIIEDIIKPKSILGVSPVMVDPIYNTVQLETTVYYNPNLTNRSSTQIEQAVRQSIVDYNETELQKFDGILRYSRLVRTIDDADKAIINNITTVKLRRIVDVIFNLSVAYRVQLNNSIYQPGVPEEAVLTNGFYVGSTDTIYYIDDDGIGNLRLFYYNPDTFVKVFVNTSIGTVNYETGELYISSLFISGIVESDLEFIIKTKSNDIVSKFNQIVNIDANLLKINVIQEMSSTDHKGSSSR